MYPATGTGGTRRKRLVSRLAWCIGVLLFVGVTLTAQTNTGDIRGTVTDASGAIVPNAHVALVNTETGVTAATTSNDAGEYVFMFLKPGMYEIDAESTGFKKFVRKGIVLEVAKPLRVDVSLETGQVTESIEIKAQTPLVETDTGSMGTSVQSELMMVLPSASRTPTSFLSLVPGVINDTTNGSLGTRYDPYYLDGVNSTWHVWGGNSANPNLDVIQEFKVLTNSYSAEFGDTSGATMIGITKSGSNEYHGEAFNFLQNDALNANNFFSHSKGRVRYDQFGGMLGGPIRKNKTFFFVDTNITRSHGTSIFSNVSVPDSAFRSGDFSEISSRIYDPSTQRQVTAANGTTSWVRDPFPGNKIPSDRISTAAKKLQALYPDALLNQPYKNYTSAGKYGSNSEDWDVRLDHNFNDNNRLTFRYSQDAFDQPAATVFGEIAGGSAGGEFKGTQRQATVSYVRIIGSRATNNLIVSWNNRYPTRDQAGQGGVSLEDLGIYGMPNGSDKLGLPETNFTNFQQLGSAYDTLYREWQTQDSLSDTFSLVKGRHNIKFGGQLKWQLTNNFQPKGETGRFFFTSPFTSSPGVNGTGSDYASFLLGLPSTFNYRLYTDFFRTRSWADGLYIQDDFRVNRKLTVNIGVRWDVPTWPSEVKNRIGIFDLDKMQYVQFGTNGVRTTLFNTTYSRFDPRIGLAYAPFGDQKTIVRAAYGIFTVGNYSVSGIPTTPIFADGDMGRYTSTDGIHWLTTLDNIPYSVADKVGTNAASVTLIPADQPMPYTQQWNLNVQHQFPGRVMLEVAYVGSHGVHFPYSNATYNLNAIPVSLAATAKGHFVSPYVPYAQFASGVTSMSYIGSMSYNSLQMKAERRFASGVGFLVAYTHNKQLDTGYVGYRDPLSNRDLDRGPTGTPTDRFVASYNWQVPVGPNQKWLRSGLLGNVVGNWQFGGITTVQSGSLLSVGIPSNNCYCGNSFATANVSGDPMSGYTQSTSQWFNTSVFSLPADYTIGNAGRGLIVGPGTFNTDLSAMKLIKLPWREGMRVEFRGEFYNVFNQTHFSNPNTTVGSATFGQILSSSGQRSGQLALKLYW